MLCRLGSLILFCAAVSAADLPSTAEKQDWAAVSTQLESGAGVNAAQADGTTALHWAAYHDKVEVVRRLLAAGAQADAANRYGITPLLLACENGNAEIVRALLDAGADANVKQRGGETALMIACRTGRPDAVKALIEKGAKIDATDRSGQTALMWAAAQGHAEVIDLLIQSGADVKRRLKSGFTALLFAAREGKSAAVKTLLQHGADVKDAIDTEDRTAGRDAPNGTSAVLLAVENGHFELAMEIIQAGADPNDMRSGFSALHTLTWVRRPPHGDDVAGQPPPDTHGRLDSLAFIRAIVAAGAVPDVTLKQGAKARASGSINFTGATPFLLACRNADLPMMKLLVELGATDGCGRPGLFCTGRGGRHRGRVPGRMRVPAEPRSGCERGGREGADGDARHCLQEPAEGRPLPRIEGRKDRRVEPQKRQGLDAAAHRAGFPPRKLQAQRADH